MHDVPVLLTDHHPAATSTNIEHAFSRGRLTVSCLCYFLSDASVCTSTLLESWACIPNVVSEPEIVALIKCQFRSGKNEVIDVNGNGETATAGGSGVA